MYPRLHLAIPTCLACATALLTPAEALAYTGPTLGLGIVGSLLAILAVLLLSLFSFVVQPLRRRWRRSRDGGKDAVTGPRSADREPKPDDAR